MLKNKKGEDLYLFMCVSTNDIKPYTYIDTWENCVSKLESYTEEIDNDRFFAQLIHKTIDKDYGRAKASMRCNKIGWGFDFFRYITIEPIFDRS